MSKIFDRWEIIPDGVRKHHDWGHADVYGEFEDCFTKEELMHVIRELRDRKGWGALGPNLEPKLPKLIKKLKEMR